MIEAPENLLAIALGGHATMKMGQKDISVKAQECVMEKVMAEILQTTRRAALEWGMNTGLLTHGSGPQTGLILRRALYSQRAGMPPLPISSATKDLIAALGDTFARIIDAAVEQDSGIIGEMIGSSVVPTRYFVDPNTLEPKKPIGDALQPDEVDDARDRGETVGNPDGKGNRILVPSPNITEISWSDLTAIAGNIRDRLLAIAGGCGGISLTREPDGTHKEHDAVIDKDWAFMMILLALKERMNITFNTAAILTDAQFMVEDFSAYMDVIEHYGGLSQMNEAQKLEADVAGRPIYHATTKEIEIILGKEGAVTGGAFPKMSAAIQLLKTGAIERAIICNPHNFESTLFDEGNPYENGTVITRSTF